MKICYFTATGNSLYVARRIGGGDAELLSIPQLMRQGSIEISDEAVGIVAPVYAVEMPMMVKEFIARAKIETDYFFFVYTYGMGYAEAFGHVELAAQEAGLELAYIDAIQMVDNYLPAFEMQDQIDTLPAKDVEGQLDRVCREISERVQRPVTITPEILENLNHWHVNHALPMLRHDTAKEYIVTDECTRCGICSWTCPANNIVVEGTVSFLDKCEVCYACLHVCPQNAIHMKEERSAVRFRNEHVSVKDLIAANR